MYFYCKTFETQYLKYCFNKEFNGFCLDLIHPDTFATLLTTIKKPKKRLDILNECHAIIKPSFFKL